MRMKQETIASGKRKAVNLSLDTGIVQAARDVELNLSQVCEAAIQQATKQVLKERWRAENRHAMEAWNDWIDKNGLPLEKYRMF